MDDARDRSRPQTPADDARRDAGGLARAAWIALALCSALAVTYFVVHAARAIAFPFPLDYGEGPLLEQGRRLAAGENIYRSGLDGYPFTIANYPPLYPLIIALLFKVLGPSYVAARVLSAAAALGCAALLYAIVRAFGARRLAAVAASALFLASPYTMFWATLTRIDFVALVLSLGAMTVAVRRPHARATPFVAAGLALLAALTRQSHLLAAPLAITAGLLVTRPRRALAFVLTLGCGVAAALALLATLTHGGFVFHTVTANVNRYSPPLLRYFLSQLSLTTGPVLAIAAARATRPMPGDRARSTMLRAYFIGTALSALTIGKVGSHVNYLLEVVASSAAIVGVTLGDAPSRSGDGFRAQIPIVLRAAVALASVWLLGFTVLRPESLEAKLVLRSQFEELRARIAAEPKPVLADETMGVLVIAGHPILLQPFEMTQLARQGLWNDAPVVNDIKSGRFGMILINDGPSTPEAWTRERWTEAMLAAVHEAYVPEGALAEATIYRPKKTPRP